MLIHILREDVVRAIEAGTRSRTELAAADFDDVDEALLTKTEGVDRDDDDTRVTFVEYRFVGRPFVVHRSVHAVMKRWPVAIGSAIGSFT